MINYTQKNMRRCNSKMSGPISVDAKGSHVPCIARFSSVRCSLGYTLNLVL